MSLILRASNIPLGPLLILAGLLHDMNLFEVVEFPTYAVAAIIYLLSSKCKAGFDM